jgi:hypothetical protein
MRLIFFAQAAKTFSDQVDTFSTALLSEKNLKTPYLSLYLLQPWISAAQNLIIFANIISYH